MSQCLYILQSVLSAFQERNVQYCLLRNYEFLDDESLPVGSLDTVIARGDLPTAEHILKQHGFYRREQQFSLAHRAYFRLVGLQKISFDVQLDGVHWNDMCYLGREILLNRRERSFYYVPSGDDAFVMLLAHSLLGKRYFKQKYEEIVQKIEVRENYTLQKLGTIFTPRMAGRLFIAAKQGTLAKVRCYPYLFVFLFKKPIRLLTLSALSWRWFLQRKNPLRIAPLISILGPDGAGKTTMVETLKECLLQRKAKVAVFYSGRGRGHILPITLLGRKYKRREKQKEKAKKFSSGQLRWRMLYTLAAPIFTFDLLLRYWLLYFPARLGKKMVITDRYGSDILLMNHVPLRFKKFLLSLFPMPRISILLYNTPEVLHSRRPEESVEELQRQLDLFHQMQYTLNVKTEDRERDALQIQQFVLAYLMRGWWL